MAAISLLLASVFLLITNRTNASNRQLAKIDPSFAGGRYIRGEKRVPEHSPRRREIQQHPPLKNRQEIEAALKDVDRERTALDAERQRLLALLGEKAQPGGALLQLGGTQPGGEETDGYSFRGSAGDGCDPGNAEERPLGSCTRNVTWEGRRMPRVYVYELPGQFNRDLSRKYRRCATDQYGTEVFFHEALLVSEFRTRHPTDADFFFVPIYGECFLWSHEMLRRESHAIAFDITNEFFLEALDVVIHSFPFWNRTGGRDHIFSFPGARGPTIFADWKRVIGNSIFLTPEGDRTVSYFNTWKDIVVPGMEADPMFYLPTSREGVHKERNTLAYFRGTINHQEGYAYSKGLRPRLQTIFQNETDVIYDTRVKDCDRACYWEEMANSVFCLCPLGWSPWTLRFYQALMVRCIPIVIADNIEFPFESEIDFSRFALKFPEKEVDDIVHVMRSMPEAERESRRRVMDEVWLKFTYQRPPQPGDAFYATLDELARKVRVFKTSSSHSWS